MKNKERKTEPKWVPLWCQCRDCLETFSVEGLVNDGHIIELEDTPGLPAGKTVITTTGVAATAA